MTRATAYFISVILTFSLFGCSTSGSRLVDQRVGRVISVRGGIVHHDNSADSCMVIVQTTIGTYAVSYMTGLDAEEAVRLWLAAMDSAAKHRASNGNTSRLQILYDLECNRQWVRLPYNKSGVIAFVFDDQNKGPTFPFSNTTPGVIGLSIFGEYLLIPLFEQKFDIKLDIPFACATHEYYFGPHEIW